MEIGGPKPQGLVAPHHFQAAWATERVATLDSKPTSTEENLLGDFCGLMWHEQSCHTPPLRPSFVFCATISLRAQEQAGFRLYIPLTLISAATFNVPPQGTRRRRRSMTGGPGCTSGRFAMVGVVRRAHLPTPSVIALAVCGSFLAALQHPASSFNTLPPKEGAFSCGCFQHHFCHFFGNS